MVKYIWQTTKWPDFKWNNEQLLRPVGQARKTQGKLLGVGEFLGPEFQAEVLAEEAFKTAAIEGERLDMSAIRSSVARRLGLPTAGLPVASRNVDGLVDMLIDATRNHGAPLTSKRLKGWHASLFPTGHSGIRKITVGDWRAGTEPMQVVSGPIGKEKVHYEAPPSYEVSQMVGRLLKWFLESEGELDGFIRAAIAHLWFVTIHPFEDGNGRIARAIADMALAQDENSEWRLYSISAAIMSDREGYYQALERTQKGSGDITGWIVWFIQCLEAAMKRSDAEIMKAMNKARLWQELARFSLNERQRKVINRLFDAGPEGFEGGLTNRKYVGLTSTTRETAKRDIADLVSKGILVRNPGAGRSVSYHLAVPFDKANG